MPPSRHRTYAPGGALRAAIGVGVAGAQAALLSVIGLTTVAPDILKGGAPVINLTLQPAPRFDSERPASVESAARPMSDASAAAPRSAPAPDLPRPRLVNPSRPLTVDSVPAPLAVSPVVPAPVTGAVSAEDRPLARMAGTETQVQDTGAATISSAAGATQGGAARVVGAAAASQQDAYAAQVLAWVERHKRHPGGLRGVVTVRFQLDRQGRVHDLRLMRSSGVRALDRAALDQISAAQPFPRPAPDAGWRIRDFTFNIDYRTAGGL